MVDMKTVYLRFSSILFCMISLFSIQSITVMAGNSFAGGSGTQSDPYLISTPEQLDNMRNTSNENFKLISDIDLSKYTSAGGDFYNNGEGWAPVAMAAGSFDGNGHEIIGLNINRPMEDNVGFFGNASVKITNLTIKNCDIKGGSNIGGIIATENQGLEYGIVNCSVSGKIAATGDQNIPVFIGGIAGSAGLVSNCKNDADISSSGVTSPDCYGLVCGGIANRSNVYNCINTGNITVYSERSDVYAGGIGGNCGSNVVNCSNSGSISAESHYNQVHCGGILGYSNFTQISKCYNTGSIKAQSDVETTGTIYSGGISGEATNKISDCYNAGSIFGSAAGSLIVGGISGYAQDYAIIENCYNIGTVSSKKTGVQGFNYTGSLIGYTKFQFLSCYCLASNTQSIGYSTYNAVNSPPASIWQKSDAQMKQKITYNGFDFNAIWTFDSKVNYQYPQLIGNLQSIPINTTSTASSQANISDNTSKKSTSSDKTINTSNVTSKTVSCSQSVTNSSSRKTDTSGQNSLISDKSASSHLTSDKSASSHIIKSQENNSFGKYLPVIIIIIVLMLIGTAAFFVFKFHKTR